MKSYLILLLLVVGVAGQELRRLGRIGQTNVLTWDFGTNDVLTGFRVWVGQTDLAGLTNVFWAATNRWSGTTNLDLTGWRSLWVTAVGEDGLESYPSETVLVWFTAGRPAKPGTIQLYSMLKFEATNDLPKLVLPPSP